MSKWFRLYSEVLDDPKVQRLSGDDFKGWINILCLAAKHDGALPPADDIAFALRLDAKKISGLISRLTQAGLLVATDGDLRPNKWDARQYKSDVSTDRVKRFRNAKRNVSPDVPETPPDTDTDTDSSVTKVTGGSAPDSDKQFWSAAKSYLAHESRSPGALIGQWARDYGKDATAAAITRAQLERPVEKVPFIVGCLKHSTKRQLQPAVPL